MSIIGTIRRAILRPKFNLNRQLRRALERGKALPITDRHGDLYMVTLRDHKLEADDKNLVTKFVREKK